MQDVNIKQEFDEIKARLDGQKGELHEYNKSLQEHMSRTALLEVALTAQKEYFEFRHDAIETRMEKQETAINGLPTRILQYVSIIGGIVGLIKLLL